MIIRQAKEEDRKGVVDLAVEFWRKSFPTVEVDEEHMDNMFTQFQAEHVLLVAVEGGDVVGFFAAHYGQHPLNPRMSTLAEVAWYVLDEYRKMGVGDALFTAYSKLRYTDISTMALLRTSPDMDHRYEAEGFKLFERNFIRFNK